MPTAVRLHKCSGPVRPHALISFKPWASTLQRGVPKVVGSDRCCRRGIETLAYGDCSRWMPSYQGWLLQDFLPTCHLGRSLRISSDHTAAPESILCVAAGDAPSLWLTAGYGCRETLMLPTLCYAHRPASAVFNRRAAPKRPRAKILDRSTMIIWPPSRACSSPARKSQIS